MESLLLSEGKQRRSESGGEERCIEEIEKVGKQNWEKQWKGKLQWGYIVWENVNKIIKKKLDLLS